MAFGSATLLVRTKTKVKIKSSVTITKTSSSAVASTSKLPMAKGRYLVEQAKLKRRESLPDPSDSGEDDDPDFGRDAKEDARREAEELAEQEAAKVEKAERRRAKELAKQRGEVYVAPKKDKKKKSRAKKEEEPERAVRKPPKRSTEIRPAVSLSSGDEDDNATKSAYDPDARKKQASARLGYSVEPSKNSARRQSKGKGKARARDSDDTSSADSSAGEGYLKKKAAGRRKQYPDTEEGRAQEIQDHLKRKWINKNDPERMTAYRKEMEEMYNPLVRLLGELCRSSLLSSDSS